MQRARLLVRCRKNIQIRNVPDDIHRRLKSRAALEGRSLSENALSELLRALERPTRQQLLERVRKRSPVEEVDVVEILRAEREAR